MKIIDVNMSIGHKDYKGDIVTEEKLLALMEEYRIGHAVCYHAHTWLDPKDGNRKMAEIAANSNGKIGLCLVLDPVLSAENLPGEGSLKERIVALKPECLRVFPKMVRTPFHPFYWEEILNAANELSLPLLIDEPYKMEFFCHLPDISAKYPNVKFILIEQGCCEARRIYPLATKCTNVYFTCERMLDNQQIEEMEARNCTDKLLFGSGYPNRPHAGALGLVLYANIREENREKILCKNWEAMA